MFCTNCGNEIKELDKFCSNCGTKLESKEQSENNEQQTIEIIPEIDICQSCSNEKRRLYKKEEYTGNQICINCDIKPGICPVCHTKLRSEKAQQCSNCFASWRVNPPTPLTSTVEWPKDTLRCRKCGSKNFAANKKGFGVGKALVGGALTGGVGLLAGFAGSRKIYLTCLKCGNKWTAGK